MHTVSYSPGIPTLSAERKPWHSDILQRKGHPAIWCEGTIHEEACLWLNSEIVPRGNSPKTWEVAARSLVSWFDFLAASQLDWRTANKAVLASYRDAYAGAISPQTGKEYSAGTIRVRMTYIIDFIRFAVEQLWIDSDLRAGPTAQLESTRNQPIDTDPLAHLRPALSLSKRELPRASSKINRLKPKADQDDKVHVITKGELRTLIDWAGPRPSERKTGDRSGSDRDSIILALGWAVGLRLQGIAGLKIYPFLEIVTDSENQMSFYKIRVTEKGQKSRQVDVPAWLIDDVQAYIAGERKRALAKRGTTAHNSALLLNSEYSSRPGRSMTPSALQALMKRACRKTGLMKTIERTDPLAGTSLLARVPKYSMHSLRHTYSVMTFHSQLKNGYSDLDAWKYIQEQLGHKHPSTTINTYLKHVAIWSHYRKGRSLLDMVR